MLILDIPAQRYWNYDTEEFGMFKGATLKLEHSLIAISKWESKYHRPFLIKDNKMTPYELLDYIKCMTINNVDPIAYNFISDEQYIKINDYLQDPMTATTIKDRKKEKCQTGNTY